MRFIKLTSIALLSLVLFFGAADAQRRTVKKPAPKRPPVTQVPPLDVRAGREKVQIQLDNVTSFVDKLGPIAQAIEALDESAKKQPLPRPTMDKIEANKQKLVVTIRGLKAGLTSLESEFRTKPTLKNYQPVIEGITDLASASEDSAIAGRFVAAKEPLRGVIKKLTDTLAAMPR
jgi:hypothetical protein